MTCEICGKEVDNGDMYYARHIPLIIKEGRVVDEDGQNSWPVTYCSECADSVNHPPPLEAGACRSSG